MAPQPTRKSDFAPRSSWLQRRGEWLFGIGAFLLLLTITALLSPSVGDADKLKGRGLQLLSRYEAISSFIVMFAAGLGCAFGRRFSEKRLTCWLAAIAVSLPLAMVTALKLERVGYPSLYREIAVVVMILSAFLVIPPQRTNR